MTRCQFIAAMLLVAVFASDAAGEPARQVITSNNILAAINDAGIAASAGQLGSLTNAVARVKDPRLRVASVERWDEHRIRVRLDCVDVQECMPFFVAVLWDQKDGVPTISRGIRSDGSPGAVRAVSVDPVVVHAASSAILQLDGVHIHIWLAVICLQSGTVGQTIHATSIDGRQTYKAEVMGSRRLKGVL